MSQRLNARDNNSSAEAMPNDDESLESQQPSLLNEPVETNSAVTTSENTEPTTATTEDSTESATTFEAAAELVSAHGSRLVATETSQASQATESRFKAITFKEGLKRKGRLKKKSKQVKFSITYLDKQSKKAKKSQSVSKASASETLSCPPVSVDNESSEVLLTNIQVQVNDILTVPRPPPRNYPLLNDEFPGASKSPYDVDHMHGCTSLLSINLELSLAGKLFLYFLYLTIFCVYCSASYVLLLLPLLLLIDRPFRSHFKYHWWGRGRDGLNVLFSKWGHNGDRENVKYHQKIHI